MNKKPVTKKSQEEIYRELQKSLKLPTSSEKPITSDNTTLRQSRTQSISKSINDKKNSAFSGKFGKRTKEAGMRKKEMEKTQKSEPEIVVENHFMDDFDAKKAVIYSEIFKRPQF